MTEQAAENAAVEAAAVQNAEGNTEDPARERQRKLRQAYSTATTRLREQYRTEFDDLYSQEAEALGVDYTPRPTAEQKAEQELTALLEQFPHLAEKVRANFGPSDDEGFDAEQEQTAPREFNTQ